MTLTFDGSAAKFVAGPPNLLINPDLTLREHTELWPQVCFLLSGFEDQWPERGGHQQLRRLLARVIFNDPYIRLTLMVDGDGVLVALALSTLESEGGSRWVFCQVGYNSTDSTPQVAKDYIEDLKQWARDTGASYILWGSQRSPRAMSRIFGTQISATLHRIPVEGAVVSG